MYVSIRLIAKSFKGTTQRFHRSDNEECKNELSKY